MTSSKESALDGERYRNSSLNEYPVMKPDNPSSKSSPVLPNLGAALAVIILVIAGEYFFRHYVLFWMPTIGTLLVNDMISLFLAYLLLLAGIGMVMKTNWGQELAGVWQAGQESARSWNATILFILLVLSIFILPIFDKLLWGKFTLPMLVSSYRNSVTWLSSLAPILKPAALILVNGIFVPIAEEYLWRGIVQARLMQHPASLAGDRDHVGPFFVQTCAGGCFLGQVSNADSLWDHLRGGSQAEELA